MSADKFKWNRYFKMNASKYVPHKVFKHVKKGFKSKLDFQIGTKVEVLVNKELGYYWVATIINSCGPYIQLQYFGDEQGSFCINAVNSELHPIGWSKKHRKILSPPSNLSGNISSYHLKFNDELVRCSTISENMMLYLSPVDILREGMKVEVQDILNPYEIWIATIIKNVGGRLRLRYDLSPPGNDFWLFYSSTRLFNYGWVKTRGKPWILKTPDLLKPENIEECKTLADKYFSDNLDKSLSADVFQKTFKITRHKFKTGMKLEAVHPINRAEICPATITKIFDNKYFIVTIDEDFGIEPNNNRDGYSLPCFLATVMHPFIFPAGWANARRLKVKPPKGWPQTDHDEDFDWKKYLKETKSPVAIFVNFYAGVDAASRGFEKDSIIESVHPEHKSKVCKTKVFDAIDHLIWVQFENFGKHQRLIYSMDSLEIFPIGWYYIFDSPLKRLLQEKIMQAFQLLPRPKNLTKLEESLEAQTNVDSLEIFPLGWYHNIFDSPLKHLLQEKMMHALELLPRPNNLKKLEESFEKQTNVEDHFDEPTKSEELPVKTIESKYSCVKPKKSQEEHCGKTFTCCGIKFKMNTYCPEIYINCDCYAGPLFCKTKIKNIPKHIGPGPVNLVMKEMITRIVNAAHVPSRILQMLATYGNQPKGMKLESIKAKNKDGNYYGKVAVICTAENVADFCKNICVKLKVCPNLFSPIAFGNKPCPANCGLLSDGNNLGKNHRESIHNRFTKKRNSITNNSCPGFLGKENECPTPNIDEDPSSKRPRYETRGVKIQYFGPKKINRRPKNVGENRKVGKCDEKNNLKISTANCELVNNNNKDMMNENLLKLPLSTDDTLNHS